MEFIQRNWEKFAFVVALVLLGLVGYRLYLDIQLREDDQRVADTVENVQETLDRAPETPVAKPAFASDFQNRWSAYRGTVSQVAFMMYMPPLVKPVLDRTPDVVCEFAGITELDVQGGRKKVDLQWEFEQLEDRENVVVKDPGDVIIQRRRADADQWTTVTSFSGSSENQYSDKDVEPRTTYEYRLVARPGGQTCEEGEFQPQEKKSTVVSVEVESDMEIVLKSASTDTALIQVRLYNPQEEDWSEDQAWTSVGEQIGQDQFSTPFTLKDIKNQANYTYWTLSPPSTEYRDVNDDGEDEKIAVGEIQRNDVKRPKMIYQDDQGKTYTKWQPMDEPSHFYPASNPAPWDKFPDKYDRFRTSATDLPWGNIPSNLRIPEEGEDASEEEGSTEQQSTENGSSETESSEESNQ